MHSLTFYTAKYSYLLIGLIALIYWLTLPKRLKIQLVVFGFITAAVSYLLAKVGAALFYDPRPFVTQHVLPVYPHAADNGFPSDHTLLSAFITVTIFSVNKKIGLLLLLLTLMVGGSRIIGHIHSPIDIIGSIVFALVGGLVAFYLTPKVIQKINSHNQA